MMSVAKKAYSRRQLITVAEVASAFAKVRDIAGLEAVEQLAQAVQDGHLSADLYPPHQRWVNDGKADRIGIPAANPTEIWRSLSKKSIERHISDKDDFNYPPAASTWHLLADDVFAFANSGTLSNSAAAALRELAVCYKAEAATDAEFLRAWGIHEQIDPCKAQIQRWERLEQNAPTPSEAIAAEGKLAGLRTELAGLLSQLSGPGQEQAQPVQATKSERPDYSMLADPDELIAAFGRITGMRKAWFSNITDKPGLKQARRVEGMKGRGGHKPLFCPLAVMLWLTDDKRKVGSHLSTETGWRLLESYFPRVYAAHAAADPREG